MVQQMCGESSIIKPSNAENLTVSQSSVTQGLSVRSRFWFLSVVAHLSVKISRCLFSIIMNCRVVL